MPSYLQTLREAADFCQPTNPEEVPELANRVDAAILAVETLANALQHIRHRGQDLNAREEVGELDDFWDAFDTAKHALEQWEQQP